MLLHCNLAVKLSFSRRDCPLPSPYSPLPIYILCDVTYSGCQRNTEKTTPPPGQVVYKKSKDRLEKLQFYIDSLAGFERSYLAARYLRKAPAKFQRLLLRDLSISDLAFNEVFSRENNGW
jgi:hypothetical protein